MTKFYLEVPLLALVGAAMLAHPNDASAVTVEVTRKCEALTSSRLLKKSVCERGWSVILCIWLIPLGWGMRCAAKISDRKGFSATCGWSGAFRPIIRCERSVSWLTRR